MTGRYFGEPPGLDPMFLYRESLLLHQRGAVALYEHARVIHPPLLHSYVSLFFWMLGPSPASYTFAGFVLLSIGSVVSFDLARRFFSPPAAFAMTALLFANPLVVVNAFYPTHEIVLVVAMLVALQSFVGASLLPFSIALLPLVLVKETALVAILGFAVVVAWEWVTIDRLDLRRIASRFGPFVPAAVIFFGWQMFLRWEGATEWRGEILGGADATRNTYAMIASDLVHLRFLNVFLLQNLKNGLIDNFQWAFSAVALIGVLARLFDGRDPRRERARFFGFLFTFTILYAILVLSIRTWTIVRYSLPLLPGLFAGVALACDRLESRRVAWLGVAALSCVTTIAALRSVDPVTTARYGILWIYGEPLYAPSRNSGNDRLAYNVQFLEANRRQNELVRAAASSDAEILVADCFALALRDKLELKQDHRDFGSRLPKHFVMRCVDFQEIGSSPGRAKLAGHRLFVNRKDAQALRKFLAETGVSADVRSS